MRFAETFFGVVGDARTPVFEAAASVMGSMPAALFMRRWSLMLFQVIRATIPVLHHALRDPMPNAPPAEREYVDPLGAFFERKLLDESCHDVMLLADLGRMGVSPAEVAATPANPFIAEMVGRQYYLIDFVHPAVYLGFIGLLEGFPPTVKQIDALQVASGFPPDAFSCVRVHAAVDVKHREALAAMLDQVPATLRPDILANALRCVALHAGALAHLSQTQEPI